jgi:predicted DNA-binding transcriptional regulator AlpA
MFTPDHTRPIQLPETGYLRLPQVLHYIPIGKSTWWAWVAASKAPKPFKLGAKTTAWKAEDIRAFIAKLEKQGGTSHE